MPINSFLYPAPSTPTFPYNVANSCRFNPGSSDTLSRTLSTPTNNKKFTFSFWTKKCENGREQHVVNGGAASSQFYFNSSDQLYFYDQTAGGTYKTTQVFRDLSAWYHIVVAEDTTQGTESSRIRIYVNGSEITDFAIETDPTQDNGSAYNTAATHTIGTYAVSPSGYYYSGYLAEFIFVDGQQLAPTDFGEFDSDSPTIWKPKDVSDLTFGNNGFHLDFEDSSALGNDVSGNDNDFTVNNLTAVDQSTDTCTNNFATLNPLYTNDGAITYSQGNLKAAAGSGSTSWTTRYAFSTIGVSAGRWYVEAKCVDSGGSHQFYFGVGKDINTWSFNSSLGYEDTGQGWGYYAANGNKVNNGTDLSTSGNSYTDGDIISMELDLEDMTLDFYKNGVKEGYQITSLPAGTYHFAINGYAAIDGEFNFGSPPHSISSGNADGNGHGNFEYSVPSGHFALCTKNLAEYG